MALITVFLVGGTCDVAEATSAADVLKAYQHKYEQLQTLSAEEHITQQAIVSEKELLSELSMMPFAPMSRKVVYHRDGRTYLWRTDPWAKAFGALVKMLTPEFPQLKGAAQNVFKLPYPRLSAAIKTVLEKTPPSQRVVVYDGKHLWQYRPQEHVSMDGRARRMFSIVDTERRGGMIWFASNVLNDALFAFPIQIPKDNEYRQSHFLPDLLKALPVEELSKPLAVERIAGAANLVLALKNQRFVLDPRFGLAVRRHEETSEGYIVRVYTAENFAEVLPGVWLPSRAEDTHYGGPHQAGGKYAGKPLWREIIEITDLEANQPDHLNYLTVKVPAGAIVFDQLLPAIDEQGNTVTVKTRSPNIIPTVLYIQPANQADLEKVVREAQIKAGKSSARLDVRPTVNGFWLSLNIGLLLAFIAVFVLRRWRRRLAAARA